MNDLRIDKKTQKDAIFESLWNFLKNNTEKKFHKDQNNICVEFGAGRFGYIEYYRKYFLKNYALDIYDFSKDYSNLNDVEFILSKDQRTIPLESGSVDLVFSHSVLEHVLDVQHSINEIDRVLKVGGLAFLTVSPLYYCYCGGHLYSKERKRLEDWEHINPNSNYYIDGKDEIKIPLGGYLNRLNTSTLLSCVGNVPWNIEKMEIKGNPLKELPSFLKNLKQPKLDLHLKEFRLLVKKIYKVENNLLLVK